MSEMRRHLELMRQAFGPNLHTDFMLKHGREYTVGPDTFAGPRGEVHGCFMNSLHLAASDPSLTYCEGKVECVGVPLDHAWCATADGVVVDPTLDAILQNGEARQAEYFGVPFSTEYVLKAARWNRIYGCLDYFFARLTAPMLYELGLEAGQQWLMDQPAKPKRRRKAA
jgi:hypothetical protein